MGIDAFGFLKVEPIGRTQSMGHSNSYSSLPKPLELARSVSLGCTPSGSLQVPASFGVSQFDPNSESRLRPRSRSSDLPGSERESFISPSSRPLRRRATAVAEVRTPSSDGSSNSESPQGSTMTEALLAAVNDKWGPTTAYFMSQPGVLEWYEDFKATVQASNKAMGFSSSFNSNS